MYARLSLERRMASRISAMASLCMRRGVGGRIASIFPEICIIVNRELWQVSNFARRGVGFFARSRHRLLRMVRSQKSRGDAEFLDWRLWGDTGLVRLFLY